MVIPVAGSSTGQHVQIAGPAPKTCGDGSWYLVRLETSGAVSVNNSDMTLQQARALLHRRLIVKAERVLYLEADRDVPFEKVASFVDREQQELQPLSIAILTDKAKSGLGETDPACAPSIGLTANR